MGYLNLEQLKKYENWVNNSAEDILISVKNVGGWINVFPKELPLWAHRVRNYFNQEPIYLTRLDNGIAKKLLAKINSDLDALQNARRVKVAKKVFSSYQKIKELPDPPSGTPDVSSTFVEIDELAEDNALYRYVYEDHVSNIWYQMDAGGSIYHFGDDPGWATGEAIYYSRLEGQEGTPIFKLVSADGTGGSMETIIKNEFNRQAGILKVGRWSIEEVGVMKYVSDLIETNAWHQGSYNYSETVIMGIGNHEKRDVETHKRYASIGAKVYVNPSNRHEVLAARKFPEKANGESNPLANQLSLKDIF